MSSIFDVNTISGRKFGKLTASSETSLKGKRRTVLCKCDCGVEKQIRIDNLKEGTVTSCGCAVNVYKNWAVSKYGHYEVKIYDIYHAMISRCYRQTCKRYPKYGGRGITVCNEWVQDVRSFYEWAINNGYKGGLLLDREDNDGHYEPDNCRFVTHKKSSRNTSRNNIVEYNGEEKPVVDWAEKFDIPYYRLLQRLRLGWSVHDALTKRSGYRHSYSNK